MVIRRPLSIEKQKVVCFLAIITAALCISIILFTGEVFKELENRSWDWRLRFIAERSQPDPNIKLIMIDQSSLEYMANVEKQVWPWPRELYVPVIEFLRKAGARGVALDILFTEPSHYGVSDDEALASSLKGDMPAVFAVALRQSRGVSDPERFALFKDRQSAKRVKDDFVDRYLSDTQALDHTLVTLPIEPYLRSATALGNVSVPNDSDGVFRHIITGGFVETVPTLTLPFALYNEIHPDARINPRLFNKKGELAVRFYGPARTYRTYPFDAILQSYQAVEEGTKPTISPKEFEGSYVFVGMDAPGLLDLRPTPLSRAYPGVEYHATALDNLLHNSFIRESSVEENILFCLLSVVLISWIALFSSRAGIQVALIICLFGVLVLSTYWAASEGIWVPLIVPLFLTVFAMVAALVIQYQLEGSQHRFIKRAFKYYVSPEIIETIIENPSALSLGGERRELSLFFCDIAGFTTISESMDPTTVGRFLNVFLTEMTQIILAHRGTVDKYVGDAIVAFWNAPIASADHAYDAVTAALECQSRLETIRPDLRSLFQVDVRLRIGVHTGIVTVGNFGSMERFNYTVIGDAANLASRLEGANKFFGTDTLMSEYTYSQIKGKILARKIGRIRVVGRDEHITVYEPIRAHSRERVIEWNEIMDLLEAGKRNDALHRLQNWPEEKVASLYKARAEGGIEWNLTEK